MQLTGAAEENVLTLLCWHEQHAAELTLLLTADLFSTRAYRKIAQHAFEHVKRYNQPPRTHLRDLLEDDLKRGDEGALLKATLDAMEGLHVELQPKYVLAELDNFIMLRKLSNAVTKASDAIHAGDLESAQRALAEQPVILDSSPGIWLLKPEQSLRFMDKTEEDFFSSGVSALDDRGCHPKRKALFLVLAPPGFGKSWWLVEIGKANLMHRKKVLHITLEMSEDDVAQRYVQSMFALGIRKAQLVRVPMFARDPLGRLSKIEIDDLTQGIIDENARKSIADRLRAMHGRLLIKEFPTATLTIGQLRAYLDALERLQNFVPDMVLIDYGDLFALDSATLRLDTSRVFREMRGIAMSRDIAMVTATQGNRSSPSARTVRGTMVAEDWSKIMTADMIVTISRTESEHLINLARLFTEKVRGAVDKYTIMISQAYDIGQFALDSVYMSSAANNEVERLTGSGDDGG